MALVNAPLLSLGASGQIGGAIVYSIWKGRPYVRKLVKPANPQTGGQTGVRAAFKFNSQQWTNLNATEQATWEDLAEQDVVAPFNAYMKQNLLRNRNFLAPSMAYPPSLAQTPDALTTFTATAGERQITINFVAASANGDNWGVMLYRSISGGFTPAFDNLIAIVNVVSGDNINYVDTPLAPDTYYYDAKTFTFDAVLDTLKGEINATVT